MWRGSFRRPGPGTRGHRAGPRWAGIFHGLVYRSNTSSVHRDTPSYHHRIGHLARFVQRRYARHGCCWIRMRSEFSATISEFRASAQNPQPNHTTERVHQRRRLDAARARSELLAAHTSTHERQMAPRPMHKLHTKREQGRLRGGRCRGRGGVHAEILFSGGCDRSDSWSVCGRPSLRQGRRVALTSSPSCG